MGYDDSGQDQISAAGWPGLRLIQVQGVLALAQAGHELSWMPMLAWTTPTRIFGAAARALST